MSEVGMALSNPYRPVEARTVGCVGKPLPGVAARIAAPHGDQLEPLITVEAPLPETQVCDQFILNHIFYKKILMCLTTNIQLPFSWYLSSHQIP